MECNLIIGALSTAILGLAAFVAKLIYDNRRATEMYANRVVEISELRVRDTHESGKAILVAYESSIALAERMAKLLEAK